MNTIDYNMIVNAINDTNIVKVKMTSDDKKYFSLFDKYIPDNLNQESKILLFAISNLDVISKIVAKNPDSKYYIFDHTCVFDAINRYYNNGNMYNITIEEVFDPDMKFDCIIMNPPYDRDLHLKILDKCKKHISKVGCCICLHPIYQYTSTRLVFDVGGLYKTKYNDFTHCKSIEIINENYFDAHFHTSLGISVWDNNIYDNSFDRFVKMSEFEKNIIKKIKQKIDDSNLSVFNNKDINKYLDKNKFWLIMPMLHGNPNKKDFYYIQSMTYEKALTTRRSIRAHAEIPFETDKERHNFYDSLFLKIMLYIVTIWKTDINIYSKYIPWLKDYKEKWTNERLKDYFELTDKEYKFILNKKLN